MKSTIPHLRPWVLPEDIDAVNHALSKKAVCHWQYAEKLSHELCNTSGMPACYLYASGTLALRAALRHLDLPQNSKVGIPSFTCEGVLYAVLSAGYKPHIIDCDDCGLMNGELAFDAFKKKNIKACIAVHQFGLVNRALEPLTKLIPVVEDCSHVPPQRYLKNSAAICGSLEGTKLIGAGEGGYLLCEKSGHKKNVSIDADQNMGGRLSDLIAVLAIRQIDRLNENVDKRNSIALRYQSANNLKPITSSERVVWFRYILDLSTLDKVELLIREAESCGIIMRRPIMPQPLHKYLPEFEDACPMTDQLWGGTISIPIYPDLADEETNSVVSFLEAWQH